MRRFILISLFLAVFSASGIAQNLVTNGGFESPALPPGGVYLGGIPGWTVVGANGSGEIQRGLAGVSGAEGKQWVELDSTSNVYIYQDVPTVAGQRY